MQKKRGPRTLRLITAAAAVLLIMLFAAGCGPDAGETAGTAAPSGQNAGQPAQTVSPSAQTQEEGGAQPQQAAAVPAQPEQEELPDDEYYSRALARRSQKSSPEDAVLTGAAADLPQVRKTWTVMIYMIGSNLESRLGNATRDLEEMAAAGLSLRDMNLIVYTGGARRWVGDVPADRNCVLDLSRPGEDRIVAQTAANANMGSPETLTGFVNFCTENYPADHTALIFWDHGGGPLWGYGADELYDSDSLMLSELKAAMDATAYGTGERRLDFVGFDACLMASLENMAIWSRYADLYIASEELEPGEGWDYTCFGIFERTTDAREVAAAVVDGFAAYYAGRRTDTYNPDITLSCVDLTALPAVTEAFGRVADRLADGLKGGGFAAIMRQRTAAKSFGLSDSGKGPDAYHYDLVDLSDLADRLAEICPAEAAALSGALKQAVVCSTANMERAGGISVYYPCRNKNQFTELNRVYKDLAVSQSYSEYLDANARQWLTSRSRNWVLGEPEDAGSEYVLRLTEDQQYNMVRASYHILSPSSMGGLYALAQNCSLQADADGVLHLPKDLPFIGISADGGAAVPWPVIQLEADESRSVYVTTGSRLRSDIGTGMHLGDAEDVGVSIRVAMDARTGEITVLDASESGGQTGLAGKNTIGIEEWKSLQYSYDLYAPVTDSNGAVRPWSEWSETGTYGWSDLPVQENFGFERIMTGSFSAQLYVQLEIEDANGDHYASTPVPLAVRDDMHKVTEKTEKGEITYGVFEDHAEVMGYSGTDTRLEVSAAVEGVPVTKICAGSFGKFLAFDANGRYPFEEITLPDSIESIGGSAFLCCSRLRKINIPASLATLGARAFFDCSSLNDVQLPEGLETIGAGAFAFCSSLEELTVPASVTRLEETALEGCPALKTIRVAVGNAFYKTQNDALLTADGKTLLAWAPAGRSSCTVPDGVETIACGAFEAAPQLERAELPSSLKEIGSYAFFGCLKLQVPALPPGLEGIGCHAFDAGYLALEPADIPEEPVHLYIGKDVRRIGAHAFDLWLNRRFAVDAENPYYSEREGLLMNKAGDALLAGSLDGGTVFVLPEGTLSFDFEMLAFLDSLNIFNDKEIKHIFVPASVVRFPESVYEGDLRNLTFHCPAGSEGERFALRHGIPCSSQMEYIYETVQVPTPAGMLTCRVYSDQVMAVHYEGYDEELAFPASVQGKPVRTIGDGEHPVSVNGIDWSTLESREDAPELKRIVIPEGVEVLSAKALSSMVRIGQIEAELPSTLKMIGENGLALHGTVSLPAGIERLDRNFTDAKLADGFTVTPALRILDPCAFGSCRGLTTFRQEGENEYFSVRDGVLYSADGKTLLHYPQDGAAEVTVPEGVEVIAGHAFRENTALAGLVLPASLKEVEEYAFYNCSALQKIVFSPDSEPVVLGDSAFAYCRALTDLRLGPVESIGNSTFTDCESLTALALPEGLLAIGATAFEDTGIRTVLLPDSLRTIGREAFGGTGILPEEIRDAVLKIGPHVTYIGDLAFENLAVSRIEVAEENETFASADGLLMDRSRTTLLAVPPARAGELTVPEGTLFIEDWAFRAAKSLTRVHIPDSVVSIGSVNFEKESGGDGLPEQYTVTICCKEGSFAHRFAMEYGIPFELE